MHKTIFIAALAVAVTAGAAVAQSPPPNPPPAQRGPGPGGPGLDGPGFRGAMGMGGGFGRGGFGGGRFREPPTPQEVQQRNAALFARIDTNRDGRITFEEFRADQERQRTERQRRMFQRFSGGADSVTLDQLNARALERLNDRQQRRRPGGRQGPPGQPPRPPAPPAAR